jgi:uncharacterized membrane protein YbhN (UPF0104 family)
MQISTEACVVRTQRKLLIAAQVVLATVLVWFPVRLLAVRWHDVQWRASDLRLRWDVIALSCGIVLFAYALLIQAWRTVVRGWGSRLDYRDAARIWTISNLGRYVPGKVWQLGTMAVMARQHGVSGLVAAGSALVVTVVNLVAGLVVAAVTGADVFGLSPWAVGAVGVLAAGTLLGPSVLPRVIQLVARATGREVVAPQLPMRAVVVAALSSVAAWVLYGLAFRELAAGVLGSAPGALSLYVAVFTSSYLLGFLALFAPGGVGVREVAMATALARAGVDVASAAILVVTSRLWLTVLEVVPALVFLAHLGVRHQGRHA